MSHLTHFTLSSYEQALCLLTFFSISGLAKLGVKPRLSRSSWRAFTSTHLLMLPSTYPRQALLACLLFCLGTCLPSLWSPLFPLHAPSLIPLSLDKAWLSLILTLPLMIWCSGLTALFFFLLEKAALAYLPTALSVALRPLFPFQQAWYAKVLPLKPAPFSMLFAGLGSTNQSAATLLFSCLTFILFSPPCPLLNLSFYLNLYGRSGRNCLLSPPALSGYNGSPDTRFHRRTTWLMSWPDKECYLCPLQSLVVYLLLSLVSLLSFLRPEACCLI